MVCVSQGSEKLEVNKVMENRELVLLTGVKCPECRVWKRELINNGLPFIEYNLFSGDEDCLNFQKKHRVFLKSVPILVVLESGRRVNIFSNTAKIKEILRYLK